jgi:opacity protein-like surface antigen
MRSKLVALAVCAVLSVAAYAGDADSPAPVANDASPDGSVNLKGGSVAVGIGYTWGDGELTFHKGSHAFSIHAVPIVDVGVTNYTASGNVYNLKQLADFAGDYVAAGAGVTLAGGGTAVYLKNEHDVVIKLIATDVGLKFKLSADGVHIGLKS